ncbi:MAG TPA: hypothetical protein VFO10_10015 [Oligoflexus sp.]|uniref:hypothetical protein n=1 Tax=Oligoflexus sp. TaxID=1971216 RepID=UPI002D7F1A08|nr:hypothetical protein [Oligoflexus sp.]HET9237576.1 hypothetical protein [Oligoflexus sp.]
MRERSRIWFAFLGGALAWTLHLMGTYALSEGFCRSGLAQVSWMGLSVMLWSLALLTFLAVAVAGVALWMARRQQLASVADIRGGQGDIFLFMARSSLLMNALFLLVILAQTVPIFILGRNC